MVKSRRIIVVEFTLFVEQRRHLVGGILERVQKRRTRRETEKSEIRPRGEISLPLESLENDADDIGKENYRPNGTREETRGGEKAGFEESDGKFFRERRRRRRRERPEQE